MTARNWTTDKPVYTSEEDCLKAVDDFADWLQGECFKANIEEPPPHRGYYLAAELSAMTAPKLLALVMSSRQFATVTIDARDELANRWLAHNRTEGNLE
jgi:hypothetical protein